MLSKNALPAAPEGGRIAGTVDHVGRVTAPKYYVTDQLSVESRMSGMRACLVCEGLYQDRSTRVESRVMTLCFVNN
jgi:hypothetical protein